MLERCVAYTDSDGQEKVRVVCLVCLFFLFISYCVEIVSGVLL